MPGGGSQFSISEIAIGTFGEAAVTERGEGEFIAKPSCHYNLLYDTPQIAQILAISDPGERCRGFSMRMVAPKNQSRKPGLLDGIKFGHSEIIRQQRPWAY